jgi:hypothetical protein
LPSTLSRTMTAQHIQIRFCIGITIREDMPAGRRAQARGCAPERRFSVVPVPLL